MSAASPGIYQALGMHLETTLVLPELIQAAPSVERDGAAILLLDHPTVGKSTLAWCLLQEGWRLLSSELVAVSPDGLVLPGMHQLKLWHDAAVALELNWAQLPTVRKGLKRFRTL